MTDAGEEAPAAQAPAAEAPKQETTTIITTAEKQNDRVDSKSGEATKGVLKRVNRELASIGVTKEDANRELMGPTRTMLLKGAKNAAAKEQGKSLNQ